MQWKVAEYDLADQNFQVEANKLGIVCHMNKKRYKICMNEKDSSGKPMVGFCRITYEKPCFLFCAKKRVVDFLSATPYQNVLDSGVRCYNEDTYPEGS